MSQPQPPLSEADQRAAVVAQARSWLGTPYIGCADVKGAGVDCGMLLVRVFVDTGLCAPFDPRPYDQQWHLHRGEEKYLGFVFDHCCEVANPQPGDVMVMKIGRCYAHGGIVSCAAPLTLIHAFQPDEMVVEDTLSRRAELMKPSLAPKFYSFWAKPQ